ncbi:hypothetical protein [Marinomonas mediterranea]|uniref:hypothetical protein n=1 Tax=Marinomonas mediterranea TaxID=119864 RepID=UPI00234AE341|nr:hypothetical protein [Marinomonas mediterranea]WCN09957.1 hypothetical protein GV055_14025 [Marinomonas mediterranea]
MDEIEKLRGFVLTTLEYIKLDMTEEALRPIQTTRSKKGLRMAANDMAETYEDLKEVQIAELDALLKKNDLPTISQMYNKKYRKFLSIISSASISSDNDFRLVSSFVGSVDNDLISSKERDIAERLMANYESSK